MQAGRLAWKQGRGRRISRRRGRPSGVARIAALAAVLAAATLTGLLLFGGGDGYTVTARFINAGQLVKGNLVDVGGTRAGVVKDFEITANGQADVVLQIDEKYAPLRARHARGDPPGRAGLAGQPLRAADAAARAPGRQPDPRRGADRHRDDHDQRGPGPVLQHLRPAHSQGAPGLLQGWSAPVRRPRRGRQPRPPLPQPAARRLQPPVRRAPPRPAGAGALPGRQLALRDRAVLAPRRPVGADRQPQLHHPRPGQRGGGAVGGDHALPAVPAPGQLHVREPARGAGRPGPAGERVEAGGAQAAPVPGRAAAAGPRRGAHRAQPAPHRAPPRRRQRPARAPADLPQAGGGGAGGAPPQRGRPPRRVPRAVGGAARTARRSSPTGARTPPTCSAGSTTSRTPAPATRWAASRACRPTSTRSRCRTACPRT